MIIIICIGYQCIGKSTLCNNKDANSPLNYIDLESSMFRNDSGIRPDDWYVYYCNVAVDLSKQHNIVFTASHKVVRDRLRDCGENVVCIFPSLKLKEQWTAKLEARYINTKSDKDYRAWMNTVQMYDENIKELMECGIPCIEITSMDYDLNKLIVDYEVKILSERIK